MEESVSNTISIIGIPKTATMEQVITIGLCSFCFLKPFAIRMSFVFDPQILGAFADHDGAPMQGMKIKNVVPGKITYIFIACFGAVERLHVPRNFAFYDNRYLQTFSSVAFVACFCKRSV